MNNLLRLIVYIDAHPWISEPLMLGGVLVTGLLAIAPLYGKHDGRKTQWRQHSWLFLAFLALTLFNCRWAVIFYPKYLNIDEAMLVAQALTYESHPIPWRDVDPTTSGPLNGYALLWGMPFGFQPSYAIARCTELFCNIGMMIFLYLAGRRIAGEVLARISILPIFVFLCFARLSDYLNYTSEQVSLLVIGMAIYLLTRVRIAKSIWPIVGFGLVVGLLPFAKLQSVLPAAALGLCAAWLMVIRRRGKLESALARCGILVLAMILPGAALLSVVAYNGALHDFWESYIEMATSYGDHFSSIGDDIGRKLAIIDDAFYAKWEMSMPIYLMLGLGGSVAVCLATKKLKASRVSRDWYLLSVFLVFVMAITMVTTNRLYIHYHYYLLPALSLMALASLRILRSQMRTPAGVRLLAMFRLAAISGGVILVFLAVLTVLHCMEVYTEDVPVLSIILTSLPLLVLIGAFSLGATAHQGVTGVYRQRVWLFACFAAFFVVPTLLVAFLPFVARGHIGEFLMNRYSPMDQAVLHFRPPGGRMAVWGWDPEFSAETGTPYGTRDSNTQGAIDPNPLLSYFRQRYLHDMEANRPELFLEAVGLAAFSYKDRLAYGIACFPQLEKLIAENYRQVAEIEGMRLYVRTAPAPDAKSSE